VVAAEPAGSAVAAGGRQTGGCEDGGGMAASISSRMNNNGESGESIWQYRRGEMAYGNGGMIESAGGNQRIMLMALKNIRRRINE